jgi:hypothetical protein
LLLIEEEHNHYQQLKKHHAPAVPEELQGTGLMIGNDKKRELEIKKAKQTEYKLQLDNEKKISPRAAVGGGGGGGGRDQYVDYYQGQQPQAPYSQKSQSSYSDSINDPAYDSNPYSDRSYQVN